MFQNSKTANQLLVKEEDEEDTLDNWISIVGKQIKKEIDATVLDKTKYTLDLSSADLEGSVSETHQKLLFQISPKSFISDDRTHCDWHSEGPVHRIISLLWSTA